MWSMWSSMGWKTSAMAFCAIAGWQLCPASRRRAALDWNGTPRRFFGFFPIFGGSKCPMFVWFPSLSWPHAFGLWNLEEFSPFFFAEVVQVPVSDHISAHEFPLLLSGSLTKLWGSRFQDPKPRRFLVFFSHIKIIEHGFVWEYGNRFHPMFFVVKASSSPLKVPWDSIVGQSKSSCILGHVPRTSPRIMVLNFPNAA